MIPGRILILDADGAHADWLRHHCEILWPAADIVQRVAPEAEGAAGLRRPDTDVILAGVDFASDAEAAMGRLATLCRSPQAPPVVCIARGGSESNAVRALRLGVADYLAQHTLTPQQLSASVQALSSEVADLPAPLTLPCAPIPQYSILRELGSSARAAVFLARSRTSGRNFALKISRHALDDPESDPSYFEREYAAITALDHPTVIHIHDYGMHDGREYLAMEYFPCGDLKARLLHPMSTRQAIAYARRIAEALSVVHAHGLVHRDLKPPNVMLRADTSIVLIDFGLAKQVNSYTQRTAAGMLRGSPFYMSPEQALGRHLDQRSDLYSLGVMLFEMLTGQRPYQGTTAIEVMQQHVQGERPALPPPLSALEPIIAQLMATDPEARFADAGAALAALTALEQGASAEPRRMLAHAG